MGVKNKFRLRFVEAGYKHGDLSRLANKWGCSRGTLTSLTNNEHHTVNMELGLKIARDFGIPLEEIFYLDDYQSGESGIKKATNERPLTESP